MGNFFDRCATRLMLLEWSSHWSNRQPFRLLVDGLFWVCLHLSTPPKS